MTKTVSGPAATLPETLEDLMISPDPAVAATGRAIADAVLEHLDDAERKWVGEIEELRGRIYDSTDLVSISLPNHRGIDKTAPLGEVSQLRSKRPEWTYLLMLLTRRLRPARVLELGTCVGISAAYLAAGLELNGSGRLVTLEGAAALAELARRHLDELGLGRRSEVVTGLFKDTLDPTLQKFSPVDLAFIDGHHDEQATQDYFDLLLEFVEGPAVAVFDDISWSDGMSRAWRALTNHPRVDLAMDLERVGICIVGLDQPAGLTIGLPTISRMRGRARRERVTAAESPVRRLNWGCGRHPVPGWVNLDKSDRAGVDEVQVPTDPLPYADGSFDYAVGIHSLQEVEYGALPGVLSELRRVLRPAGVLRLGLPDLEKLIGFWRAGQHERLLVPDEAASTPSGKLILHALWFGHTRTLFTAEFIQELLERAGFRQVHHCRFGETTSAHPEIASLDNRSAESLFVEAIR